MALAKFLEGTAFGVLNDILSSFHSEDGGYAVPNRFEVIITRPGGSATESRKVSMRCESINLPGRNLNSTTDSNIYGPTREIVERSWNVGYYNDYISTVDIYILDRQNQRRFGLKLHEAFPKTIGATELSQAANNELIKLAVTFSFRYWTTLDVERQRPSLSEKIFDTITTGVERQISSNLPKVFTRLF